MEEVRASDNVSLLVPENDSQELWQLTGRVYALHDWMMSEAAGQFFSSDQVTVCVLMGFKDIIKARAEIEKEKASVAAPANS